ncbi:hypothetical protein [Arthrobacter sp. fls2-241-R2A-172]|uniref:hypothetical protein n=1 Tax=Arthrobacter sp. fls2-241-R2A-172 TaxID=3040325 RepID=UPI00254E42AF|nr:hypothetical protein [Arthrobacter sp. fls2-241-R2A-172]
MGALRRLDGKVVFVRSVPVVAIIGQQSTSVLENCDTLLRGTIEDQLRACRELAAERAAIPAEPVNPELVVRELNGRLPSDAQVSIDVGSCVYWYARQLILPEGVPAHVSGTLSSMGCAIPYGLAAKLGQERAR